MITSINIDIAKLRGWRVEKEINTTGAHYNVLDPDGDRIDCCNSCQNGWDSVEQETGDFENSADACIRVCDEMGWERAKGFKVNSHQFRVRGCLHTSKNTWNLGKEIAHIYYGTTFALALKAALEGEME